MPYQVRSDRVYTTKAGLTRRRSTLELLESDVATVVADVSTQLVSEGFRKVAVKDSIDGLTRLAFAKKDYGRINITGSKDVGDKPSNPKAVGLLSFDWPVDAAPSAITTTDAHDATATQ